MNTMTERFTELMNKKGIKAVDLANAIHVNTSTISRVLKGIQTPTADTLYKSAEYFQVTMEYLLTGVDAITTNCVNAEFTNEELLLNQYYRGMTDADQDELLSIAKMKYERAKKNAAGRVISSASDPKDRTSEIA